MNLSGFQNVLVLGPHTDDGEMGAGGTIASLLESGARVTYVAFSAAEKSVPETFPRDILRTEIINASAKLGLAKECVKVLNYPVRKLNYLRQEILEDLVQLRNQNSFDLVFLPCSTDLHQDHETIYKEGIRAFKHTTILGYEFVWNNLSFNAQCLVKLNQTHVQKKVAALQEYRSQCKRVYANEEFVVALAKTRGVQISSEYAEAFEVIRLVMQ